MHRQLKKQQESIAWHLRSSTTSCLHFGAKFTLHNLSLIYIYIVLPQDLNFNYFSLFMTKIHTTVLQGTHLPFSPSPLRVNIFRLFVILSLTQLYRYTPEIFLFSTATFKYTYPAPLRRIGQEYSANVA